MLSMNFCKLVTLILFLKWTEQSVSGVCVGICPTSYTMDDLCVCHLGIADASLHCPAKCADDYDTNDICECVLKVRPPLPPCDLTCEEPFELDEEFCQCVCTKTCEEPYNLNTHSCECDCTVKCLQGSRIDQDSCTCVAELCRGGERLINGSCIPVDDSLCQTGQLMIRDVCITTDYCPPGFLLQKNNLCKHECCTNPCTADQEKCGPEPCGEDHYIIEGECKPVIKTVCKRGEFFNMLKPRCPETCEEPVQLSECNNKWTGPGCSCLPGFVLHEDQCIHPDSCPRKPICLKDSDILIMLDSSVSIGVENFKLMKGLLRHMIMDLNLEHGVSHRLAAIRFNHHIENVLKFDDYKELNKQDMLMRVDALEYEAGLTHMGEALHHVRTNEFLPEQGLRTNMSRLIILMTDGTPTNGAMDPNFEARMLREMGVQILILKLGGEDRQQRERLYDLAGENGKIYVFALRHYRDIATVIKGVVNFRCTEVVCPQPRLVPHKCEEEFQYYDKVEFIAKETGCETVTLKNIIKRRCACPQEHEEVSNCVDFHRTIKQTSYEFERKRNICHEHVNVKDEICSCPVGETTEGPCEGEFKQVKIVAFHLETDSKNNTFCQETTKIESVRCACPSKAVNESDCLGGYRIERSTVHIFHEDTLTCESEYSEKEVRCDCPPAEILTKRCTDSKIQVKVQVQHINGEECIPETFVGFETCQLVCDQPIDVGIVVDTSSSMLKSQFLIVKQFLIHLVGKMHIGEDFTRVTLVSYSSAKDVRLICDFFTFFHIRPLQQRINELKFYSGTTSTGEALREYRLAALTKSHGSRIEQHARQILYLITDGLANGEVDPVEEAKLLREMGVQIVIIAIGNEMNAETAEKYASDPVEYNVFLLNKFEDLFDSVDDVSSRMCEPQYGTNEYTVKQKFKEYLHEMQRLGPPDAPLKELPGEAFKNFVKLDDSDYCRYVFHLNAYLSVIAGVEDMDLNKFESTLVKTLTKTMKVEPFEIQNVKMTALDEDTKVRIDFDGTCEGGDRLGKFINDENFILRDKEDKPVNVAKGLLIVSSNTRKALLLTNDAHTKVSQLVDIVTKALKNLDVEQTLQAEVQTINQRIVHVHELLSESEDRALRLITDIHRGDLGLLKKCRENFKNVVESDEKEGLETEFDSFVVDILKTIKDSLDEEDIGLTHYEEVKNLLPPFVGVTDHAEAKDNPSV